MRRRAVAVLGLCAAALGIAAWLRPDPSGYGSHRQLGQAPCSWIMMWGIPCPTCGMTTAFAHTVRGHVVDAVKVQPMGFLLAAATVGAALLSVSELVTGRGRRINWYRVRPWWTIVTITIATLAAWIYKILTLP